ncbi:hypothetical protein K1T73_07825 [Roseovarius sp. SCSIO 43702]|uniref:hypothetical protein n=1 Tax=Roseovarius sp. SCSIO 43702 TaxID=2823043 RepID=UPI001C72A1BE|nr:hypothetical protein [Roseovarius sp. SCSIO 43702]QYX58257.1 hypothetical protein K1T73_07825 [Roseovarius sp. SCSIO 43702]
MKKFLLTAVAALSFGTTTAAQAGDAYIGFDLIGARSLVDFGGFNTAGGFSNDDNQQAYTAGLALKFGMRDQWTIGGRSITPELEFAWYDDYSTRSASFPGLPAPTFFYNTSIDTARLGVNAWTPFHDDGVWRAEAGAGLGMMYRDVSTNDTVVRGSKSDYAPYGQFGLRFLRKMGDRGTLSLGTSYLFSDDIDVPLRSGAPAGNFKVQTNHVEISVGYQINLAR